MPSSLDPVMTAAGSLSWLLRQPDGAQYLRRALWGALSGLGAFYTLRYGLGQPDMALYSLFGALPLSLFSQIPGTARERTRTLLAVLPVGLVLVTAGTLLAARSWSAACGMFVVAFTTSYLGAGGPGLGGLATSFQLYYLLPCFPPYAPETLGHRLTGLATGILLSALVNRLLWAGPEPAPYRLLLADAVEAMADYCAAVGRLTAGEAADTSHVQEQVARTMLATRMSHVAPPERPTAASLRDRALFDTHSALRHVGSQLDRLAARAHIPDPATARLLDRTATALRQAAHTLRTQDPAPASADALTRALDGFTAERTRLASGASPRQLRQHAITFGTAEATQLITEGTRIAFGAPLDHRWRRPGGPFAYAMMNPPARWWRRLRLHLTPRSVLLQNALRSAVALAAARLIVGTLDLPHGFWALLATLSLLRTSASDTRGALLPAFLGTAAGAAVAAVLVMAVGDVPAVYIAVAPVVFVVGFSAGPVLGPPWVQGALTITLVVVFAQIEPPDLQIPTWRFLDVVIGGSLGAAASLLAWPRGAQGELRRSVADFMDAGAQAVKAVTDRLGHRGDSGTAVLAPTRRRMWLAQAAYAQHRTEKASPRTPEPPWELAMAPGYSTLGGGELLLSAYSHDTTPLPPEAAARLTLLAGHVADQYRRSAEALRRAEAPDPGNPGPCQAEESGPLSATARLTTDTPASAVLLVADLEAWLTGISYETSGFDQAFSGGRTRGATGRPEGPAPP
ncbi:FUSC family protein [Streptomyces sp. NPDC020379]|uniref:FUSC family protein n=1 Tax=Streptomyces sp. NPDC020379 TaxID=3365071 RepID=UPI00378EBC39